MSIDYTQLPPPQEGDLPPFWKPTRAGEAVEGQVADTRIVTHNEYGDAPCIDVLTATGETVPVLCSTMSLYRQVYALRPEVGGMVRITFQGYAGKAKLFDVQYAPPVSGAPVAAPAPAPPAAPAGFGSGAAAPWGNQPAAPAPAPPAAPPWGQ